MTIIKDIIITKEQINDALSKICIVPSINDGNRLILEFVGNKHD